MGLYVKNFYGSINGKNIYDFTRNLDYNLKQKERIDYINNIIEEELGNKYFEELFTQTFHEKIDKDAAVWVKEEKRYMRWESFISWCEKRNINFIKYLSMKEEVGSYTGQNISHINLVLTEKDNIYSETNIAKELEKLADYILNAPDGERISKKTKYNFYTNEELFRKEVKEKKIGDLSGDNNNEDEIIDFLIKKCKNFKKEIKQVITYDDLEDESLACLQDYENAIFKLKDAISNLKKINKDVIKQRKLGSHIIKMKEDQILCKDFIKGTIYFKQPLPDSNKIDWDKFDFSDKKHALALLSMSFKGNFSEDLYCLLYDMENLINSCNFTSSEKIIIMLLRKNITQQHMGEILKVSQPTINYMINKIVNKIINAYRILYESWFYNNIEKSRVKKCNKCGISKLVNENYFRKRADKKGDGYYNCCRKCEKNKKVTKSTYKKASLK